jgi:hypothetical protein
MGAVSQALVGLARVSNAKQVLGWLRLSGRWSQLCDAFEGERAVVEAASARGLSVDAESLQTAVDAYRKTQGLVGADETQAWLDANGLSLSDVELHVTSALLRDALEASLTDDELLAYAKSQDGALDRVRISVIESASPADAKANLDAIAAGGSFEEIARARSTDGSSGPHGGQLEWFARRDLPAPFVAPLFEAASGSVVGPIAHRARWYVVRCDEGPMSPPVHTLEPLRAEVAAQIVAQIGEQAR